MFGRHLSPSRLFILLLDVVPIACKTTCGTFFHIQWFCESSNKAVLKGLKAYYVCVTGFSLISTEITLFLDLFPKEFSEVRMSWGAYRPGNTVFLMCIIKCLSISPLTNIDQMTTKTMLPLCRSLVKAFEVLTTTYLTWHKLVMLHVVFCYTYMPNVTLFKFEKTFIFDIELPPVL